MKTPDVQVADIEWTTRAKNVLDRCGIHTLSELSVSHVMEAGTVGLFTAREFYRACMNRYIRPTWFPSMQIPDPETAMPQMDWTEIFRTSERRELEDCLATLWPVECRTIRQGGEWVVIRRQSECREVQPEEEA